MSQYSSTSLYYKLMRAYTNLVYPKWFYDVKVNGVGNIPEGEPVIFAPNHQNAFVDAMALLYTSPQPVVFWVRGDLFQNKWADKILRSLKMMPAYRMRNGVENLKKNDESIENSVDILTHDLFLCLMPEGGQDEKRRLRPLVKGIFRSAFAAQEKMNDQWVKIVPVGIDYGHYDNSGRHLIVSYGRPLSLKDYYEQYQQSAPQTMNKIKADLAQKMAPLMLNIQEVEDYDTFYTSCYLYNEQMLRVLGLEDNHTNRLIARQKLVALLDKAKAANDAELISLRMACAEWNGSSDDVAFRARVAEEEGVDLDLFVKMAYLIVASPFFLYGLVMNFIPLVVAKCLGRKAKGSGFEASFKMGSAMLLCPIVYLVETAFFPTLFHALYESFGYYAVADWSQTLVFFFTLPISLLILLRYTWKFQYVKERIRNVVKRSTARARNKAIECIQRIVSKYKND
ncbi:MAG: 1-acyl-sn-glycerol-3-phosphate acyltransferase [Paludibacteraceae bacterium]|nr:1-acyl-sn-glycerol-3-phosphate acyltransferase [Paludibacteraceae bacterium]